MADHDRPLPAVPIGSAMDKTEQDDNWSAPGRIGQTIHNAHLDFDTRTYGHRKLSALVQALKGVETRRHGNQPMMQLTR